MKKEYVSLLTIMVIIFTLTIFGYSTHDMEAKVSMKENDVSSSMGKPVYESKVDSLSTKVWVMTQAQHKKMMKEGMGKAMSRETENLHKMPMTGDMNDSTMGMDKASKKEMMKGTHFIMLDVINTISGKEITNGSAKVQIVYPSKKNIAVDLNVIMSHFGSALTLNEKGKYLFTINIDFGGDFKTTQFKYTVR
jgi:hypothetical protein